MIDDQVLERLLQETVDQIQPPDEGPERILIAASTVRSLPRLGRRSRPAMAKERPRPRRLVALGALTVTAGVLAVGLIGLVSGSSSPSGNHVSGLAVSGGAPLNGLGSGTSGGSAGAAGGSGAGTGTAAGTQPNPVHNAATPQSSVSSQVPSSLPTKVIKTGTVSLQVPVGKVDSTVNGLTSLAASVGGFVASTNTSSGAGGPATGDLTLRVPVDKFEFALNQVRSLGTPISVTTSGQDVTSQYVDLNARLQSLEDTRTQFEQVLSRAQSIGDILSVEQQISDLQTQIEQLQGQLNVLDDQTAYGTLTVHVAEATKAHKAAAGPPTGLTRAWDHTRHTFAAGLEAVVSSLGGIAAFLVVAALLALLTRVLWVTVRQRLV